MNKKGFTLVELLAVIVILAVVMLIAVTSVGPMMERSRKNALGTEGIALLKAAKAAYQSEQMKGSSATYKSTSSVCLTVNYLCKKGYFEKGCNGEYSGSVLILRSSTGEYTYNIWISNGTYYINGATLENIGNVDDENIFKDVGASKNKWDVNTSSFNVQGSNDASFGCEMSASTLKSKNIYYCHVTNKVSRCNL